MSWQQDSSIGVPCQRGAARSAPDTGRDTTRHLLAARYGTPALSSGFTAIPNVVFDHSATLGVSAAELAFVERVARYQHDTRAPFPAERTIAAQMGRSTRQIRNYIASLRHKGFLRVLPRFCPGSGRQTSNAYDFTPLIEAAVAAATAQASPATADDEVGTVTLTAALPRPATGAPAAFHLTRKDASTLEEKETNEQTITIRCPLPPTAREENACPEPASIGAAPSAGPPFSVTSTQQDAGGNTALDVEDDNATAAAALGEPLAALGRMFGDRCPAASVTRAVHLLHGAGLSVQEFLRALDEAARRTLAASRRRHAPRPRPGKLMAYLFAVLENLLYPSVEPAPRHRPRPRPERPAPDTAEAAGSHPEKPPVPLVEEHPIWRAVLEECRDTMTPENLARCARARVVGEDGSVLRLAVPDAFHLHWLERVRHRFERALTTTGHAGVRVAFVLAEQGG